MASLVEVKRVSKTYTTLFGGSPFRAVNDLSMMINSGSIYGLLGPNGAGKTTLIKMICGLVVPTSGTIVLDGYDVSKNPEKSRIRLGAVLEGNRNIHWRLSPIENLCYFGQLRSQSRADILKRAERLLSDLNLMDKKDTLVSKLSRGMQQKVSIAVALISDPEVILLDEPTLGLDVETSIDIKGYLKDLAKGGKAILLTTHQLDLAQAVCDVVGIVKRGELVREIKLKDGEILDNQGNYSLEAIFLDTVREEKNDKEVRR